MEQSIYRISLEIQASHAQAALDMKRGDTGRRIFITFTDGGNPYPIGEDCYAVFTARKPDENPIFNPCAVAGDTIVYDVTPQTTAAPGRLDCEIKLYGKDDRLITSPAFTITVHDAVFHAGDEPASEAEVEALTHLVSQTNTLLTQVRQDLESGAFQGEKGDKGEPGPQGEKGEKGDPGDCAIDDTRVGSAAWSAKNIVDRLCPGFSETGPAVVCRPVEGYPLEVVSYIQPTQSGSGDPSPISGHSAVTLWRGGKNLFDGHWEKGFIIIEGDRKGKDTPAADCIRTGYIPLAPRANYFVTLPKGSWYPVLLDQNKENGRYIGLRSSSFPFQTGDTECFLRIAKYGDTVIPPQVQVELGSVATEYEPYRGEEFTLELGQTVYGGTFNWTTGVLTDQDGNTQQLTPQQIAALPGDNVLWSDTGDTAVSGKADLTQVIQTLTNGILALGGNI